MLNPCYRKMSGLHGECDARLAAMRSAFCHRYPRRVVDSSHESHRVQLDAVRPTRWRSMFSELNRDRPSRHESERIRRPRRRVWMLRPFGAMLLAQLVHANLDLKLIRDTRAAQLGM
jgi:hypothetical protein